MSRLFSKVVLLAVVGVSAAACQDSGYATTPGANRSAYGYATPYNAGYYAPAPVYARPVPAYGYAGNPYYAPNGYYAPNQPGSHGYYNQVDGRRYTTVMVTNRGQNGHRDDVVRQQVVCGSQYYDGYQTRTAPTC